MPVCFAIWPIIFKWHATLWLVHHIITKWRWTLQDHRLFSYNDQCFTVNMSALIFRVLMSASRRISPKYSMPITGPRYVTGCWNQASGSRVTAIQLAGWSIKFHGELSEFHDNPENGTRPAIYAGEIVFVSCMLPPCFFHNKTNPLLAGR